MTVKLKDVENAQRLKLTLANVSDGTNTADVSVPLAVLLGDVNQTGVVDGNDVSAVQATTRRRAADTNFKADVNATGRIDGNDVSITQANARTGLP